MQYLSVDYLIVYAFLAITLFIGIRAGIGVKDIRDYVIANKSFGVGALVLTSLATNTTGAGVMNLAGMAFSKGVIIAITGISAGVLGYVTEAVFIAPKFARFKDSLTMGDLMKKFYGTYGGIIAGILGFLNAICIVGMDLIAMGMIGEALLGIKAIYCIVIGGVLLAAYSAYGGIRSVTATDIFQFIILFVVIPLIASVAIHKVGSIKDVFLQVPSERLAVISNKNFSYYLVLFFIYLIPAGMMDPAIVQRLLMAKTGQQLRKQYFLLAAFHPVLELSIMMTGLAGVILYPTIEPLKVVPHIIQELFPIGLKGLAITGMLSLSMSSIDSYLHAAGITFIHDVIKPICTIKKIKIDELRWIQYGTVLLSSIAIFIALYTKDIFGLLLGALAFTGPLLMFPLLAPVLGLKSDTLSFYVALVVTVLTFLLCTFLLPTEYEYLTTLISILANGITFFGIHIIKNKGFTIINHESEEAFYSNSKKFLASLKDNFTSFNSVISYSREKINQYGAPYVIVGVFLGVNFIFPYFMTSHTGTFYYNLTLSLRLIGAVLCALLIVKDKWPASLQPYLPTYWHFIILYCLPFMATLMFLLAQGGTEWLINIAITIILLFILVDWLTGLILTVLGTASAIFFHSTLVGPVHLNLDFSTQYLLIYQIIFSLLIGLIFARRKEQRYDQLAMDHQSLAATEQENSKAHLETFKEKIRLIKTLKNANIQNLPPVIKGLKELRNQIKTATTLEAASWEHTIQDFEAKLAPIALNLTRIDHRAINYLRLDIHPIAIDQLLEQLQKQLPNRTLHYLGKTKHQQIVCDPIQLIKVLRNTIRILPSQHDSQPMDYYLAIQDTKLAYPMPTVSRAKDYVKYIPAIRFTITQQTSHIPDLANSYTAEMSSSALPNPTSEQELLLATNQRIIKAHYGYTNLDSSKQTTYEHYLYVIPADLNEIRPADMNNPDMELGVELVRANDKYPGAPEQEQAFLKAVQQKSTANIENVKSALELIKWYHGAVSRRSGEPYYLHPLSVAQIVLDWNQDEATIIGALLHDTVEDTAMLLENIDMIFGHDVVQVVDYVTHFESFKDSFYRGKLTQDENLNMLLQATDKRALFVKVADRMHNMRTIEGHKSEDKKRKISQETLHFFIPLAMALGIDQAAEELMEMSNRVLNKEPQ